MKNCCFYFENRECEYFPCHTTPSESFNCLFCYCPLYTLGDQCGGNFRYTDANIKDCSQCMIPHRADSCNYIHSKFNELAELAKKNHTSSD